MMAAIQRHSVATTLPTWDGQAKDFNEANPPHLSLCSGQLHPNDELNHGLFVKGTGVQSGPQNGKWHSYSSSSDRVAFPHNADQDVHASDVDADDDSMAPLPRRVVAVRVRCKDTPGLYLLDSAVVACWCEQCKGKGLHYVPTNFERHAHSSSKKWKESIRIASTGKSIGDWMAENDIPMVHLRSGLIGAAGRGMSDVADGPLETSASKALRGPSGPIEANPSSSCRLPLAGSLTSQQTAPQRATKQRQQQPTSGARRQEQPALERSLNMGRLETQARPASGKGRGRSRPTGQDAEPEHQHELGVPTAHAALQCSPAFSSGPGSPSSDVTQQGVQVLRTFAAMRRASPHQQAASQPQMPAFMQRPPLAVQPVHVLVGPEQGEYVQLPPRPVPMNRGSLASADELQGPCSSLRSEDASWPSSPAAAAVRRAMSLALPPPAVAAPVRLFHIPAGTAAGVRIVAAPAGACIPEDEPLPLPLPASRKRPWTAGEHELHAVLAACTTQQQQGASRKRAWAAVVKGDEEEEEEWQQQQQWHEYEQGSAAGEGTRGPLARFLQQQQQSLLLQQQQQEQQQRSSKEARVYVRQAPAASVLVSFQDSGLVQACYAEC